MAIQMIHHWEQTLDSERQEEKGGENRMLDEHHESHRVRTYGIHVEAEFEMKAWWVQGLLEL
jgi:hypothetical protein